MDRLDRISIIIPAYNAAQYITICLDSVLRQTYPNWEAVIIDDGSTDTTAEICRSYQESDPRIRFYTVENGGVSAARNAALELVSGDYITFIDADDWIEADLLETAIQHMRQKADIVFWNYQTEKIDDAMPRENAMELIPAGVDQVFSTSDIYDLSLNILSPSWKVRGANSPWPCNRVVWNKLFRREILQDLRFAVGMKLAEDSLFCCQAFQKAKRISYISKPLTHYRVVESSANQRFRPEMEEDLYIVLHHYRKGLQIEQDQNLAAIYSGLICEHFHHYMRKFLFHRENKQSNREKYRALKRVITSDRLPKISVISPDATCQNKLIMRCLSKRKVLMLFVIYYINAKVKGWI